MLEIKTNLHPATARPRSARAASHPDRFTQEAGEPDFIRSLRSLQEAAWGRPSSPRPPDFFAFSSEPLGPKKVQKLLREHGKNIMIGVDPTYEGYEATEKEARKLGARLHVYLEGPGGPTGDAPPEGGVWAGWEDSERERITRAANALGIDPNTEEGMAQWNDWGWKKHSHKQLREFKSQGFESAELDNLYRGLGDEPARLVEFYREYASWVAQGDVCRLLMKNVDLAQMKAVEKAIREKQLPRETFSDFAIWETSAGPLNGQDRIQAGLGIRTLVSDNTFRYAAEGPYGLKEEPAS